MANTADEGDTAKFRASAEELLENYDSVVLISAAIKLLTKEPDTTPVKITEEAPLRVHKNRRAKGVRHSGERRSHNDKRRSGDGKKQSHSFAGKSKGNADYNRYGTNKKRKDGTKEHKEPNRSAFKPYFKS